MNLLLFQADLHLPLEAPLIRLDPHPDRLGPALVLVRHLPLELSLLLDDPPQPLLSPGGDDGISSNDREPHLFLVLFVKMVEFRVLLANLLELFVQDAVGLSEILASGVDRRKLTAELVEIPLESLNVVVWRWCVHGGRLLVIVFISSGREMFAFFDHGWSYCTYPAGLRVSIKNFGKERSFVSVMLISRGAFRSS